MMICLHCERNIDTDFDLDGTWTDSGYICTGCTELAEAYKEACRMEEERDRREYLEEEKATQIREDQRYSK